jgi:hypothetical protein
MLKIQGDHKPQAFIARGALDRSIRRSYAVVTLMSLLVALGAVAGWLHAEVRTYLPYTPATQPDTRQMYYLLAHWVGACRLGDPLPASMAEQQCAVLIPQSSPLLTQQKAYQQMVSDKHLTVLPTITGVNGSGTDYVVDWDEAVTSLGITTVTPMTAYISIVLGAAATPLLNPGGVLVQNARIVSGVKR